MRRTANFGALKKCVPAPIRSLRWRYRWLKGTPEFSCHPRASTLRLVRWAFCDLLISERRFVAPDGTRFASMPNNFVACSAYLSSFGEAWVQRSMLDHLRAGDTCVDVGANIGTWAIRAGRKVGPTGRVIAIEAHPVTFGYLQRNIASNCQFNVSAFNLAAGAKEASAEVNFVYENAGETHIVPGVRPDVSRIPERRIDDLMKEAGVRTIDYLKLDVEGYEFFVLEGARDIIAASPRIVVQTELMKRHTARYGLSVRDVIDLARSFGLRPHKADFDGRLVPIDGVELEVDRDVLWKR